MSLSGRLKEMEIGVFAGSLASAVSSKTINYHFGRKAQPGVRLGSARCRGPVRGTVILLRCDCDIGSAEPGLPGPS